MNQLAVEIVADVERRKRWLAHTVLCLGVLMIVLDSTIANVALPSIRSDLGASPGGLVWIANAYMLAFGGTLLPAGRLADLYGRRRAFLTGVALFTLASLFCGLSQEAWQLIVARAIQGIGGAIVVASALSLVVALFSDPQEHTRANAVYSFVAAGGGSAGLLLGGVLTSALSWHAIFLVNVPIGVLVLLLSRKLLTESSPKTSKRQLDGAGAIAITSCLVLLTYAAVEAPLSGWLATGTLAALGAAALALVAFVWIEALVPSPLIPLRVFRSRALVLANVIGALWAGSVCAWYFVSALYMQRVLGYDPWQIGLAYLPGSLLNAIFALGVSARLVLKFGVRGPLVVGVLLLALGLAAFSRAPLDAEFVRDVLPATLLLGVGAGIAFNPLLLVAMRSIPAEESGLASGIVNSSFMMGSALGLAVLASVGTAHTRALLERGADSIAALAAGYGVVSALAAVCVAIAVVAGLGVQGELRRDRS